MGDVDLYYDRAGVRLLLGDCRAALRSLPANSVNMAVCSPPYFGLRSYLPAEHPDKALEIGSERTPAEYIATMVDVFREVRRVLHPTGSLWLNLGDSYSTHASGSKAHAHNFRTPEVAATNGIGTIDKPPASSYGLSEKNLLGMPWALAQALQQPYYTGRMRAEADRVWLAAILDAEGTICGFTHQRKDNGDIRRGIEVNITNSNRMLLDKCFRLWPTTKEGHNAHGKGHLGSLPTWRWVIHGIEEKSALLRELYPYFVGKQKQALLAWNFLEISRITRGRNKGQEGDQNRERYAWIVDALSRLNHLEDVDVPSWCKEPPLLYEPGWILRSEITWCKKACMPESVTDRPTSATEKIFLFAKQARYFYDAEAVREAFADERMGNPGSGGVRSYAPGDRQDVGRPMAWTRGAELNGRNLRNYWLLGPEPFPEAHFATFVTEIPKRAILAGTSEAGCCSACGQQWVRVTDVKYTPSAKTRGKPGNGTALETGAGNRRGGWNDTPALDKNVTTTGWRPSCQCPTQPPVPAVVLDPFSGSGTTVMVAKQLGRHAVGIDLSATYHDMAIKRLGQDVLPFRIA